MTIDCSHRAKSGAKGSACPGPAARVNEAAVNDRVAAHLRSVSHALADVLQFEFRELIRDFLGSLAGGQVLQDERHGSPQAPHASLSLAYGWLGRGIRLPQWGKSLARGLSPK